MQFQIEGTSGVRTLSRSAVANLADFRGSTLFGINYPYARNAQSAPPDAVNLADLWWGGLAENGWGVSLDHDGATQLRAMPEAQWQPDEAIGNIWLRTGSTS